MDATKDGRFIVGCLLVMAAIIAGVAISLLNEPPCLKLYHFSAAVTFSVLGMLFIEGAIKSPGEKFPASIRILSAGIVFWVAWIIWGGHLIISMIISGEKAFKWEFMLFGALFLAAGVLTALSQCLQANDR